MSNSPNDLREFLKIGFRIYETFKGPTRGIKYHKIGEWMEVYSIDAFLQGAYAKVVWHDDEDHCPTWTGACSCDSEGVTR